MSQILNPPTRSNQPRMRLGAAAGQGLQQQEIEMKRDTLIAVPTDYIREIQGIDGFLPSSNYAAYRPGEEKKNENEFGMIRYGARRIRFVDVDVDATMAEADERARELGLHSRKKAPIEFFMYADQMSKGVIGAELRAALRRMGDEGRIPTPEECRVAA